MAILHRMSAIYKRFYCLIFFLLLLPLIGLSQGVPSYPVWVSTLNGAGQGTVEDMKVDLDGNSYVTGDFTGTIDIDPSTQVFNLTSNGLRDIFIAKYDATGALVWARSFGGNGMDHAAGAILDWNGSVTVTGFFSGSMITGDRTLTTSGGDRNSFILLLDFKGAFLWANAMGSSLMSQGDDIAIDTRRGERIVVGQYLGDLKLDDTHMLAGASKPNAFCAKYTRSGEVIWGFSLGVNGECTINSVETVPNDASPDGEDIVITGSLVGTVIFDVSGTSAHRITTTAKTAFMAKYTSKGKFVWVASINGADDTRLAVNRTNGDIYLSGTMIGSSLYLGLPPYPTPKGAVTTFIAKFTTDVFFRWVKLQSGSSIKPNTIAFGNGNVYVGGQFSGSADFNASGPAANKNDHGAADFYIVGYDANGDYLGVGTTGAAACNAAAARAIAVDSQGDLFVAGQYCMTVDFDLFGCRPYKVTATAPNTNMFLAKYTAGPTLIGNNTITAPAVTNFCGNGDPDVIKGSAPTGGTGVYTYQWQRSANNVTFVNISGATAIDLDLTVVSSTGYYRRVTSSGQCIPPHTSNVVQFIVQNLPPGANNTITAPSIRTFCGAGDAAVITGSSAGGAYQWQISPDGVNFVDLPGATAESYDPPYLQATTYYRRIVTAATCTANQVSNITSIVIDITFDNTIYPLNTIICNSAMQPVLSSATVPTGPGVITLQWQSAGSNKVFSDVPGANDVSYTPPVQKGTRYYRRVLTSTACAAPSISDIATVTLTDPPVASVIPATPNAICEGGSVLLTAGGGTTYKWSPVTGLSDPNIANPLASPIVTTTYTVKVSTGQCTDTMNVTVKVIPRLQAVNAGADQQITEGESKQLNGIAMGGGNVTYSWLPTDYLSDPTIANPIANPPNTVVYTLTVTPEQGCFTPLSDAITIKVNRKVPVIVVPNSFSPNNDGVNDLWEIPALSTNATCLVNVFNRNGAVVYTSKGYAKPWDGTTKGKSLPYGTYYYTIDLQDGTKARSGWVAIIK